LFASGYPIALDYLAALADPDWMGFPAALAELAELVDSLPAVPPLGAFAPSGVDLAPD